MGAHGQRPRSQEERSAATRRRLCTATVQCLAARGYNGTSTAEIARSAGLSQGAIFRHYPTKTDLMADAADQLYDDLRGAYRTAIERAADAEDVVAHGVRALWDLYQRDDMVASNELVMAARTDQALRRALRPVLARNAAANVALATELLPTTTTAASVLDTVLWAMQGAAMDAHIGVAPPTIEGFLATVTDILRRQN